MDCCPALRRWMSLGGTFVVFAGILGFLAYKNASTGKADEPKSDEAKATDTWPIWGGSTSRNLVNLWDKNIPSEWDITPDMQKNIKYEVDLGSKAYGGPILADGKLFIGTNNDTPRNPEIKGDKGIMMCFKASDGSFLWQAVHDKLPAGRVNDWPHEGICSAPVVEGKKLYYVSNRAEVVCADTEGFLDGKNDGEQDEKYKSKLDADFIWRLDMIKELNVFPHNLATCSAMVVGDILFVITSNGVAADHIKIPQPDAPSFIGINKNTGELLWKQNYPGKKIMHGQWSNPVYAAPEGKPQVIFPGGDGWIYGLEPKTGELIWKFDCNPKDSVYILGGRGTRNDFVSTPVVYENKLYIGVGQDPEHNKGVGHLWCIDITKKPANDEKDLSPVDDNFDPKAAVNKNSGLVWHYGGDVPKGADYSRPYYFGRTLSTASIHEGLLYIGEYDGILHCFDAKTGEHHWEENLNADTWCSPYWVDGKIYIGTEGGEIYVFAHGKEKKLVSTIEMEFGCHVRATPVVADGVMYVMSENPCKLYAIKKKD